MQASYVLVQQAEALLSNNSSQKTAASSTGSRMFNMRRANPENVKFGGPFGLCLSEEGVSCV
jgi:hypothetical protein